MSTKIKSSNLDENLEISGTFTANNIVGVFEGNADTATALETPRTITIGSTGKTFDGSADVSWALSEIGVGTLGEQNANNAVITGGNINGTTIGASSASTGVFTSLTTPLVTNAGTLALSATGANIVTASTNGVERLRIDALGNALFNTTSTEPAGANVTGTAILQFGGAQMGRLNSITLDLNRDGSDGTILNFRKSATTVGSVSVAATAASYNTSGTSGLTGVDANTVAIRTNLSERMRITSAGNVGIGTSAPATRLEVRSDVGTTSMVQMTNASTASNAYSQFRAQGDTLGGMIVGIGGTGNAVNGGAFDGNFVYLSATPNAAGLNIVAEGSGRAIKFFTNGSAAGNERLRIDSAGNVGIGLTNPTNLLQVNGTIRASSNHQVHIPLPFFFLGAGGIIDEYLILTHRYVSGGAIPATGLFGQITGSRGSTNSGNSPGIQDIIVQSAFTSNTIRNFSFRGDSAFFTRVDVISVDGTQYLAARARTSGGQNDNGLYFSGMLVNNIGDNRILTRVRESDSDVTVLQTGVATVNSWDYSVDAVRATVNGTERLRINSAGNVGIGTSAPDANLDVLGALNPRVKISGGGTSTTGPNLHIRPASGGSGYIYWAESNVAERGILGFAAGSGDLVYRSQAANFATGTERLRITGAGNVGIGTSAPDQRFTISGVTTQQIKVEATEHGVDARFAASSFSTGSAFSGTFSNHPYTFITNNTERLRITSAGNVLIGSTFDTQNLRLRVIGRAQFAGKRYAHFTVGGNFSGRQIATIAPSFNGQSAGLKVEVLGANGGTFLAYYSFRNAGGNWLVTTSTLINNTNITVSVSGTTSVSVTISSTGQFTPTVSCEYTGNAVIGSDMSTS